MEGLVLFIDAFMPTSRMLVLTGSPSTDLEQMHGKCVTAQT